MKLDIEAIAREAGVIEPIDLLESNQWRQDTLRELSRFAALLLEKAAQVCEGMHEEDRPGDYAYALRQMAAGLGE